MKYHLNNNIFAQSQAKLAGRLLVLSMITLLGCSEETAFTTDPITVSNEPASFSEENSDSSVNAVMLAVDTVSGVNNLSTEGSESQSVTNADKAGIATVISNDGSCQVSGTYAISFDDADDSLFLSSGDSNTFTFDRCQNSALFVDGTMFFDYDSVTLEGGFFPTFLSVTAILDILTSDGDNSVVLDGDLTMVVDIESPVTTVSYFGSEFNLLANEASLTELRDFSVSVETDNSVSPALLTSTFGGVFAHTDLGVMTIATVSPFVRQMGSLPTEGQATFTSGDGESGDGSSVRITAQSDGESVQVEIDVNGDGSYDLSETKAWSEL